MPDRDREEWDEREQEFWRHVFHDKLEPVGMPDKDDADYWDKLYEFTKGAVEIKMQSEW